MDIFPAKNIYTPREWASIFGGVLASSLLWSSHFVIEYGLCLQKDISLDLVNLSYFGCLLGGLIGYLYICKLPHYVAYISAFCMYILSIIFAIIIQIKILFFISLFLIGFSSGAFIGVLFTHLTPILPDPKYNGRVLGWGYLVMNIIILLQNWLIHESRTILNIIFLVILSIIIISSTLWGKNNAKIAHQSHIKISFYMQGAESLPFILNALFWGFFMTVPIYSSYYILNQKIGNNPFFSYIRLVFIAMLIMSLPVGIVLDKIGRKKTLMLGLFILSLGFLSLIISNQEWVYKQLYPIILGVGFALILPTQSLLLIELSEPDHLQDMTSIGYFFMALGMMAGGVLGIIFKPLFLQDPIYLTVILLFWLLIVAIVISQIRETLPNKEELEWKSAIQYISILYKSGLTIYSQQLNQDLSTNENQNECLLGGALVAVSSILDEIAQKNQPLKVIKKEGFSILLEETDDLILALFTVEDLKIIRKKMRIFLEDFEDFFKDLIAIKHTNVTSYLPTKRLVKKHFQYYW